MTGDDSYYLVMDGQNRVGPFPIDQVVKMVKSGTINTDTPIWKQGMESWSTVGGIWNQLLPEEPPPFVPPPIPPHAGTPTTHPSTDAEHREAILEIQRRIRATPSNPNDYQAVMARMELEREITNLRDRYFSDLGPGSIKPAGQSAGMACFLSIILVGLGQIYLGQTAKGLLMLLGAIVIGVVTAGVGAAVAWLIAVADAYTLGKKLANEVPIGKWEFF